MQPANNQLGTRLATQQTTTGTKTEMARDPSKNRSTRTCAASYTKNGAPEPARPSGPLPLTNRFIRSCLAGMPETSSFSLRKLLEHRWELVTSSIGHLGKDFVFDDSCWIWNTSIRTNSGQFLAIMFPYKGHPTALRHGISSPVTRLKKSPVPYRYKDSVTVGNHCLTQLHVRVSSQLAPCRLMVHQRVYSAISTQEPLQTCFYKGDDWAGLQFLLPLPTNGVAVLRIDQHAEAVFVATVLTAQQAHVLAATADPPQNNTWNNTTKAVVG